MFLYGASLMIKVLVFRSCVVKSYLIICRRESLDHGGHPTVLTVGKDTVSMRTIVEFKSRRSEEHPMFRWRKCYCWMWHFV